MISRIEPKPCWNCASLDPLHTCVYEINVSAINEFQLCQQKWVHSFVNARVMLYDAPALTTGTLWHRFLELTITGTPVAAALAELRDPYDDALQKLWEDQRERQARELETGWEILNQAGPVWKDRFEGETLAVETKLSYPLFKVGNVQVMLIGMPDRIRRIASGVLHQQHKTMGDSVPVDPYLKHASISLHELMYAILIRAWMKQEKIDAPYLGSEFNILRKLKLMSDRKCSKAPTKWHQEQTRPTCEECNYEGRVVSQLHAPEEVFVQEIVPIEERNIRLALVDVEELARQMVALAAAAKHTHEDAFLATRTRASCLNRYGGGLCPYFEVCHEGGDLMDDSRFKPRDSRYAEVALAEGREV